MFSCRRLTYGVVCGKKSAWRWRPRRIRQGSRQRSRLERHRCIAGHTADHEASRWSHSLKRYTGPIEDFYATTAEENVKQVTIIKYKEINGTACNDSYSLPDTAKFVHTVSSQFTEDRSKRLVSRGPWYMASRDAKHRSLQTHWISFLQRWEGRQGGDQRGDNVPELWWEACPSVQWWPVGRASRHALSSRYETVFWSKWNCHTKISSITHISDSSPLSSSLRTWSGGTDHLLLAVTQKLIYSEMILLKSRDHFFETKWNLILTGVVVERDLLVSKIQFH